MAGYKDIAAESPLVPDDGQPYEVHARRIYKEHFGHEPPQRLVDHWRECQKAGKNPRTED
jgi:hypothetical protein